MSDDVKNVFISHIHEDDEVLGQLKSLARRGGLEIRDGSIDSTKPNNAKNPDYIMSSILAPRIDWASTLVVLVSPDTHKSDWVNREIEYAHKQGKRIVGIWDRGAKDADLPENLDRYNHSLVGWDSDSLVDAITGTQDSWYASDGSARSARAIARVDCQ